MHPIARTGAVRAVSRASTSTIAAGQRRLASGGGGYNQPTGYIFGEKPPAPGQKRVKEDWENLWTYGMLGGMALGAVILIYKPDTSIQTWAAKEAKARLEESGKTWKYTPSPNSGHPQGV